eukprot:CAMPEP_0171934338 /NCGR_PEP_ID=MMETSP0993-20121228/31935_1 /TAXON_ID=483369 /ORGANISM="non described non described, Strain CCMP2098" /LENGTH=36 /DNA_ID= /DNA_START= /DNA_END= /DNA_ORIENTATION=
MSASSPLAAAPPFPLFTAAALGFPATLAFFSLCVHL